MNPNQMQGSQVGGPLPNPPQLDPTLLAQTQDLLRAKGLDPNAYSPQQLYNIAMQPANHQVKSMEAYSSSVQQSMKAAMNANSNVDKGMPPNANNINTVAVNGAQGSPMSQATMEGTNGEFYANGPRMNGGPNGPGMPQGGQGGAGGNHALQDYQMQLMLLEQQNKKRLLMARQEQDSMAHPTGMPGPNGQFVPGMSPQGSRAGEPSPNPNEMQQRGTPKIGKLSPNGGEMGPRGGSPQPGGIGMMAPGMNIPPEMRQQIMMQQQIMAQQQLQQQNGGQPMMRPPSSHPIPLNQMAPEQIRMLAQHQQVQAQQQGSVQQQFPNGAWQQQPGFPGQPQQPPGQQVVQPNMTPRQGTQPMPPPPPPPAMGASGTQPSSPAQAAAPPTPNQNAKVKGGKKELSKKVSSLLFICCLR